MSADTLTPSREICPARLLADRYDVPLAFHIASSREEAALSRKRYGVWPMMRLENLGVLGWTTGISITVSFRPKQPDQQQYHFSVGKLIN